jgi:putative hydrolase of the HAD superfamily
MRGMTAGIEAVLFDLDDTLLDGDAAGQSGLRALLALCPSVDWQAAVAAWDTAFREHFPPYLRGEITMEQSRAARMRAWADLMAIPVRAGAESAWFDWYLAGYQAGWSVFGDVAGCLDALAGLRLGVITNGDGEQQRAKITAIGLDGRFEVVIASGDAGFPKPDPRIFHMAADALGLPPGQCLFVGDNRDGDAVGARAAGMHGVWLNRRSEAAGDDMAADDTAGDAAAGEAAAGDAAADDGVPEITSLAELPGLVLRGR